MPMTRPRNAEATRAGILTAARARFGADGYDRTTLRAIAADVGVDPALVIRYFGNKQQLFAAAAEFELHLPDLTELTPDEMADALLERFFAVWERDSTFIALLRAAMTSDAAAETMRQVFATQVAPTMSKVVTDNPGPRAALIGSLVIGMATTRYVIKAPAVAALGHEELKRWARPIIRDLLVGPPPR
ncbi:TetR/AcrR family transcriptional regulator [Mycolicibacterium parafortuitum]|nr:TetR family transcriptional regulator [Mycolicibacterium parafortuitum]ORB29895.1 TetR family transcriptional regulator [Mycolicibacterium parafortuitum]